MAGIHLAGVNRYASGGCESSRAGVWQVCISQVCESAFHRRAGVYFTGVRACILQACGRLFHRRVGVHFIGVWACISRACGRPFHGGAGVHFTGVRACISQGCGRTSYGGRGRGCVPRLYKSRDLFRINSIFEDKLLNFHYFIYYADYSVIFWEI